MANVENLNFEIILKDENFRKRVAEDMRLADEMNTHLSNALDFNKKIKLDPLKRVTIETKKMREEMDKFNKSAGKDVTKRFTQMNAQLFSTSNLLRTISQLTGVAFSVVGLRRFLSSLIDITGQFEVQKMALRNMLQDIDKADKIFDDLYQFSSRSTYRFSELAKYAKQLAAFNIAPDNILETTKRLGDVASGVGVSMDRLILAYGHVKSSGFLRGIQLRSFSQNGVPVLEELSKMLTEIEGKAVSLGDVFDKMMKREITFEMVEEAFRRMTGEGGKFYQMQEVLAKTLAGQINILKGKWENLMYAIGESQDGILKGVVGALTKIVSSTESFGKAVRAAVIAFGAYQAALILCTAATYGWATAINVGVLGALKKLIVLLASNPFVLIAGTIAAVTVAVISMNRELTATQRIEKALADTTDAYNKSLGNEMSELNVLIGRMKSAREGTEEYAAAKAALEKRFDPYIQQLRNEGVAVNNLAALYDGLAQKITNANKQKFLERAQTSITDAYGDSLDTIEKQTARYIKEISQMMGREISGDEQGAIRHYVSTGERNAIFQSLGLNDRYGNVYRNGGVYRETESYYDKLHNLYNQNLRASEAYADSMADAAKKFDAAVATFTGEDTTPGQHFTKSEIVSEIKAIDADLAKIRSNPKLSTADEDTIKTLEQERETWTAMYKTLMGVDYDKQVKATTSALDKAENEEIQNIKASVALLEKYRSAREKLEPYFGADTNSQLAKIFGEGKDYDTLDAQILELCDSLRKLGDDGVEAADAIETRLGLDKASALIQAQKALQKWQTTLRKWEKDWGGSGYHGIEYDIDKVIREYYNTDDDITREYIDAQKEIAEAHKGDAQAIELETKKLNELVNARRMANSDSAQEKLNDLADKYVKEKTKNMSLKDWGDKSIGQVRDLYRTLTELANGEVVLDETLKGRLAETGLKIEDFANLAKENFEELSEEARQELQKKLADVLKEVASDLGSVVEELGELADTSGNRGIVAFADAMREMLPMVESTIGRLAQGDYIGAVVGWLSQVATGFFRAKQEALQFEAAIRSAQEEARRNGFSDMLSSGVDSIFGQNDVTKINNAVAVLNKAKSAMSSRASMESFSVKRGFWDWFVGHGGLSAERYMRLSLTELAQSVGRDLYDAYGNLNTGTLQAILDTYEGLGQAEREWIEQAITDSDAYADAMEQLDDVMESVFGKIAADAASQIVDQWAEAGDAALEYADIIDDVARSYAKMITQSMLLDSVLTEDFKQQLRQRFSAGDTAGAMELILGGLQQMQAMAPEIADALEPLRPYIQTSGSSSGNTLKEGISKELVEGNSTLIASYLNAMRADISVIRLMQTGGWSDIRFVRENVPSLVEYTAQIAASNHDIAQSAQSILAKLQSVITPSTTGGSAVRTTK